MVYLISWWWLLFISQWLYVLFLLYLSSVCESTLPILRTLSSNDRRTEWPLQEIEFKTRYSFLIPSSVETTQREPYVPTLCFSSFLISDAFIPMHGFEGIVNDTSHSLLIPIVIWVTRMAVLSYYIGAKKGFLIHLWKMMLTFTFTKCNRHKGLPENNSKSDKKTELFLSCTLDLKREKDNCCIYHCRFNSAVITFPW